ncbi:hypothetical protein PR202_ga08662 [Eleusine coracana subsp. coracana]|uniref:Phosphatidylinositol glycan anchor biosynthesis class U protein n=1 Tax=Eleusine coracana subsp. coracana TaxID=191504 RepID=A0AAV5C0V0_ELECO|nr:hypothetical protein PR202_ga08662 [Eleusine coracana subsp. coracana]
MKRLYEGGIKLRRQFPLQLPVGGDYLLKLPHRSCVVVDSSSAMAIRHYWPMAGAAIGFRLVLVLFGGDLHLASRPEVSTPLTSLRRLAEGYWLKQASLSPYSGALRSISTCSFADFHSHLVHLNSRTIWQSPGHDLFLEEWDGSSTGSMYHGSPLLLSVLGPLTHNRSDGQHAHIYCRTYGFILTVKDLSPNIGVLWYFFAEVFDFFRSFFLMVFNLNIIFMVLPLAIRLKHRPCFLAFVYTAVVAMLKSYPLAGDSALYLGLLGIFANELAEMQFTFFLFFGYIGVSLLSPVMHNLWIWRGTGNANFYFATGLSYTCLQTVLVVESVSSMIKHDRKLRLLVTS